MRKLLFVGVVLAVIVSIFLFTFKMPSPDTAPATRGGPVVTLIGTTNIPGKGTGAHFYITNRSDQILVCSPEAIEHLVNGVWINKPLVGKAMWRASREWSGFQEELKPHGEFMFTVMPPTNSIAWRVVVRCQERALVRDTVADVVSSVTATNAVHESARQFSGNRYSTTTPAVYE